MIDTKKVYNVEMNLEDFGELLNGKSDPESLRVYQMTISFKDGNEIVTISNIGELKYGQEFDIRIKLVGNNGKERK